MLNTFNGTSEPQIVQPDYFDYFLDHNVQIHWQDMHDGNSKPQTTQMIFNKTKDKGLIDYNSTTIRNVHLWSNYEHDRKSRIDARIQEFFSYGEDWDGDGAKEIPLLAIYQSLKFLGEFRSRFFGKEPSGVAASPDGEVVLYWYYLAGYAEINFDGNDKLSMCYGFDNDEMQMIEEDFQAIDDFDDCLICQALTDFLLGQNDRDQEKGM